MRFWAGFGLIDLLVVCAFLLATRGLYRFVPALKKLALPEALLAGAILLVLGPGVFAVVPLDHEVLERVVYHGLALLFVAMGLRRGSKRGFSPGARSIAFAVPFMTVIQGLIGLVFVLFWGWMVHEIHPGIGWMLPLGFSQGPGQALSMGAAWEESGMSDGGQIGLMMAALGYIWCAIAGVAIFHVGRHRGWAQRDDTTTSPLGAVPSHFQASAPSSQGDMEPLTMQVAQVGLVYLLVYLVLLGLSSLLADKPGLAAMIWGFHFLIGLGVAMLVRFVRDRLLLRWRNIDEATERQQDVLLARIAGVTVDVAAVCAIAAVRVDLLLEYWVVLALIAAIGGATTLALAVWLAKRAFPEDPFAHTLVLFGMSSGTLPTGLVLLRLTDPDLRSSAADDVIVGVSGAFVLAAPLLLVVMPMPILGWPDTYPLATIQTVAVLAVYAVALLVGWRWFGPLRMLQPLHHLWPKDDKDAA